MQVCSPTLATEAKILEPFREHRDRIAIFHFAGHANGYELLLESIKGETDVVKAQGFAQFLKQQQGLQLVFLNGCSTMQQVKDLHDAGIPAVIATSLAIDDREAAK